MKERKYDEATQIYQRAMELDPRNGEAYYRLALMEWELGRGKSLESNLVRAVDLQPSNMDALEKLSELYLLSYRHHDDLKWRQRYMAEMGSSLPRCCRSIPARPGVKESKATWRFSKATMLLPVGFLAALQAAPEWSICE